jgi:hypothetical protein
VRPLRPLPATCPTFVATGLETESPRGRLYLIKAMSEASSSRRRTQSATWTCASNAGTARQSALRRALRPHHGRRTSGDPRERPGASLLAATSAFPARSHCATETPRRSGGGPPTLPCVGPPCPGRARAGLTETCGFCAHLRRTRIHQAWHRRAPQGAVKYRVAMLTGA